MNERLKDEREREEKTLYSVDVELLMDESHHRHDFHHHHNWTIPNRTENRKKDVRFLPFRLAVV